MLQTVQIARDIGITLVCVGVVIAMVSVAVEGIRDWLKERRKRR